MVDQVGRGRSGDDPQIYGPYMSLGVEEEESTFTAPENFKLLPQAILHTQVAAIADVIANWLDQNIK